MKQKKKVVLGTILVIVLFCLSCSIISYVITKNTYSSFGNVKITNYDMKTNILSFDILLNKRFLQQDIYCYVSSEGNTPNLNNDAWQKAFNGKCSFSNTFDDYYVFLKTSSNNIIGVFRLSDYIESVYSFSTNVKTLYVATGSSKKISYDLKALGNKKINWEIKDPSVFKVVDNYLISLKDGNTTITGTIGNKKISFNAISSSLIVSMPEHFNYKKQYLPCNIYSRDEASLLDKILFSRIEEVGGYKTRAAVVAAGRFLALEFPYRIDYFYENGRVSGEGVNYADGEGRYYHVGLYLNKDKFSTIKYTFAGPVIWGCPLMNYEDFGSKYVNGKPNSNGLDCSGFVSWTILNGGYDVGDRGAGETPSLGEMTDLGERVIVTKSLIDSNTVKAGDLVNWWGHVGIIIGIDDSKYYVAESLDVYQGLVVKEYLKTEMPDYWTYIMKMDSVYKNDGNYTDMWY